MSLGSLLIRAPNHLGDGVMALPAVSALARAADRAFLLSPPWGEVVYAHSGVVRVATAPADVQVAVLLGPSFRAAWASRKVARRVGLATDFRGWLLTDPVTPPQGHRSQEFTAVVAALGVDVEGPPRFRATCDRGPIEGFVGLNPVSRSGAPVLWQGFAELACRLPGEVRVFCGPGEEGMIEQIPGRHVAGLPLAQMAGALAGCRVLVSNDTGMAHFAAACGVTTVVVHGSTTASRTGPVGAFAVEGPALPCRPCYRKRCRVVRPGEPVPCLEIPVERVLSVVLGLL